LAPLAVVVEAARRQLPFNRLKVGPRSSPRVTSSPYRRCVRSAASPRACGCAPDVQPSATTLSAVRPRRSAGRPPEQAIRAEPHASPRRHALLGGRVFAHDPEHAEEAEDPARRSDQEEPSPRISLLQERPRYPPERRRTDQEDADQPPCGRAVEGEPRNGLD